MSSIKIRPETIKRFNQLVEKLTTQSGQQMSNDDLINLLLRVYEQQTASKKRETEISRTKAKSTEKRQFIALLDGEPVVTATTLHELAQQLQTRNIDPRRIQLMTIPDEKKRIHFGFRTQRREQCDANR